MLVTRPIKSSPVAGFHSSQWFIQNGWASIDSADKGGSCLLHRWASELDLTMACTPQSAQWDAYSQCLLDCTCGVSHSVWSMEGYLFLPPFVRGRFWFFWGVPGSMLSCFSDFLLLCFSAYIASLLFLLLCFSASLLFCFSAFLLPCYIFLLFCFFAFCFPCFSAFPASLLFCFLLFLLFCFSASLFSLLLCFSCFSAFLLFAFPAFLRFCFSVFSASPICTSVPFYFYYSTFPFLQSCVFAALLPAPLLLCFLSLLSLCFSFSFALFCSVCILNETLERP